MVSRMPDDRVSRADLHCHSRASAHSRLGVQRAVGLPECATPAHEVYTLAKRRGMDFVTITDHDTIDGALAIADRPDTFVSEELTASFGGEPHTAVHVLCWGITADDHVWLQAHATDVERCASYLHERGIACALAHPYYFVRAPLEARHLRTLAELFPLWETRNGSRAAELNAPAVLSAEKRGAAGTGGSDDHAGIDVGRTWTQTPSAVTVSDFLGHLRAGTVNPGGSQGDTDVWAHTPIALAARALGMGTAQAPRLDAVARMVAGALADGHAREGAEPDGLGPQDARDLLVAWVDAVGLDRDPQGLVELLQDDRAGHDELRRRAIRAHERLLHAAAHDVPAAVSEGRLDRALATIAEACLPALPYVATTAFLGRERARVALKRSDRTRRVALVADALDGIDGVTRLLAELRERGVPGWQVDVIGTDAAVDRRLPTTVEIDVPYYPGRLVGVPTLHALAETLASRHYDLVHVCSPGPTGVGAALLAELLSVPLVISHHTELSRYARLRSGRVDVEALARAGLTMLYRRATVVLSPGSAADASVAALGVEPERVARWTRGVDAELFRPQPPRSADGTVRVLYAGRLSTEKGVDLLAEAFLLARARDPRLHLMVAGGGPEEQSLRERLGRHATFLGWLDRQALAHQYATADLFCFPSRTDTFGQVVLEAQASGLAVIAVAEGGPLDLVDDGDTGMLCPPDPQAVADTLVDLATDPARRGALGAAAAAAAQRRTWQSCFSELAAGYERAVNAQPAREWAHAA
jgi:glycosyltransferase involved in cell wall biosynthesis/predicted metal-dependent phosphoesterase TrpH